MEKREPIVRIYVLVGYTDLRITVCTREDYLLAIFAPDTELDARRRYV